MVWMDLTRVTLGSQKQRAHKVQKKDSDSLAEGRSWKGNGGDREFQGAAMSCFLIMVRVTKVCSFGKILYTVSLRSVTFSYD